MQKHHVFALTLNPNMNQQQSVRGMRDVLPEEHNYWNFLKRFIRHTCRERGIRRITVPTLEYTDVFKRGVGDYTDIVQKEMYTFESKSGKSLTMRPEWTAGIVRAYIQNGMHVLPQPVQLYSLGPVYRYERPKAGRYREHFQWNTEILGGQIDPLVDAEIINLVWTVASQAGIIKNLTLKINSIGCKSCRPKYLDDLTGYYESRKRSLCDECHDRLGRSSMRLLDCKNEDCRILAKMAPKMIDALCPECDDHHKRLKQYLDILEITFEETSTIVRGQDYYTKTVFEFQDQRGMSRGGGGRYDDMVETMGGQKTAAVGVAIGIENWAELMRISRTTVPNKDIPNVFVCNIGEKARLISLPLVNELRKRGIKVQTSVGNNGLGRQLKHADASHAHLALIIGEHEVRMNKIIIKDLTESSQKVIDLNADEVEKIIREKLAASSENAYLVNIHK